jgi:hypothetical protein
MMMKLPTLWLTPIFVVLVACASGPRPIYVDTKEKPQASAIVVGRSISSGAELVVLHNQGTNAVISAIRSVSLNREQEFVIALEPGTYVVQALGAHGYPISPRENPYTFTIAAREVIYIGTFVNEFHPPEPNEAKGPIVRSRIFGRTACKTLLCTGYLDFSVNPPFARVGIVDETETLLPRLRAEVPVLKDARITTRLAN